MDALCTGGNHQSRRNLVQLGAYVTKAEADKQPPPSGVLIDFMHTVLEDAKGASMGREEHRLAQGHCSSNRLISPGPYQPQL